MRRFVLVRFQDVSGVSGTGIVANGVLFKSGKAVLHWNSDKTSVAVYDSIEDLAAIHGHNGSSEIRWIDDDS